MLNVSVVWVQVAEARGGRDAAALLRAAQARTLRQEAGSRDIGSGQRPGFALAAPSAPPLPAGAREQQAGAGLLAYPGVYRSVAHGAERQQQAAGAAGAAQGATPQGGAAEEEAPAGGVAGVVEAVATVAWLPVRAAADLAGQAAGWARWAAAWDDGAAPGKAAAAAGAGPARDDGAGGAAGKAGQAGMAAEAVDGGGANAGCGVDADGKVGPAAQRSVPRRFGLPEGGGEDDSDEDAEPGEDAGPPAYT